MRDNGDLNNHWQRTRTAGTASQCVQPLGICHHLILFLAKSLWEKGACGLDADLSAVDDVMTPVFPQRVQGFSSCCVWSGLSALSVSV